MTIVFTPENTDELKNAVSLWITDKRDALGRYGKISDWNTVNVINMSNMFSYTTNFNEDISRWNTSNVTNMSNMFNDAKQFNADIGQWDTSNVTDMSFMFHYAKQFNKDISQWDTSNVTDMSYMFLGAKQFNKDISKWDTKKVTNMSNMFHGAKQFNADIGQWDTSNVTDMGSMFSYTKQFNKDISQWNTKKVTNMSNMFHTATNFNADIGRWNIEKVTDMSYMFWYATKFNADISDWNIERRANMEYMFQGATQFDQNNNIRGWDTRRLAPEDDYDEDEDEDEDENEDDYDEDDDEMVATLTRFVDYGEIAGAAFEVHNIFRKMNKLKYINHIMAFFSELTLEQRDNNPFIISGSGNLTLDRWNPIKMKTVAQVAFEDYIIDKSDREKESENNKFNSVFNKLINCAPDKEVKQLTNSSLAYMWSSDWSDDERGLYIYNMINDSAEAYDGNNTPLNISCIQGIFERFILGIRDMIQIKTDTTPFQIKLFSIITNQIPEPDKVYELWREEVNTNAKYKNIKKIISKRDNNANIVFDNVDAVALKKSYRDFMKTKYEVIITHKPTLDSKMNENQIKQFIDYVPVHIQDGGRKKKKNKKHNTKKKRGKKNNTKKKMGKKNNTKKKKVGGTTRNVTRRSIN